MMSKKATYRYIFILSLSLCMMCGVLPVCAQTDTATTEEDTDEPPARKKFVAGHQLAFGIDLVQPIRNSIVKNRYSYEAEIHYYLKNEYYAVAEGGWGGSEVTYDDLKYNTTNYFGRAGFNKSILYRESAKDWDMMFVGLRAAMSNVNRGAATYTVIDSVWGNLAGVSPGKSFVAAWAEITTGMRIELAHGILVGWNGRAKFLMNGKSFKDLAPLNIAGYGRGDKNSNFDFNLYLSYAIRWKRKAEEKKESDKETKK